MSIIYIYGLTDPSGVVRYIGKTINLQKRLKHHIYLAKTFYENTYKARWIRTLLNEGMLPGIEILTTTDEKNWQEVERQWIADNKDKLTNTSAGGGGVDAPRTVKWRERLGNAHRGKKVSQATKEKLREIQLAKRGRFCKNGHEFTEENTTLVTKKGNEYRQCRKCSSEYMCRRRREKGLLKGPRQLCKYGHPLSGDNLRLLERRSRIERICRECVRIRNRRSKARRRTWQLCERAALDILEGFMRNAH